MAETNTTKKTTEKAVEKTEKEQTVAIMIPFIEGEDLEQVVGVNGKLWKIQKGIPVDVPISVAQVISNSNIQNMVAMKNREKLKNQVTDL